MFVEKHNADNLWGQQCTKVTNTCFANTEFKTYVLIMKYVVLSLVKLNMTMQLNNRVE